MFVCFSFVQHVSLFARSFYVRCEFWSAGFGERRL